MPTYSLYHFDDRDPDGNTYLILSAAGQIFADIGRARKETSSHIIAMSITDFVILHCYNQYLSLLFLAKYFQWTVKTQNFTKKISTEESFEHFQNLEVLNKLYGNGRFLGMAHSWIFPSVSKQRLPPNHFHDSTDNNSTMLSIFDDMNKMMANVYQRFEHLFGTSSFPMNHMDDWMEDRKKLDAVEPVCNTTIDSSTTTSSLQKNRRKKFRNIQRTTCIKELIIDGKKQLYKEMNVTDEKGVLISQSKIYQTISINTNNNTIPIDINGDKNVVSY